MLFPDVPAQFEEDDEEQKRVSAQKSSDARARLRHLKDQRMQSARSVLYKTETDLLAASKTM